MCSSIVSSTMDHQDGKRTKIIQQEDDSPIEGTHTICDLSALNQSYVSKLKMAENCILYKNNKIWEFLFSSKQHNFGNFLLKLLYFALFCGIFQVFLASKKWFLF